MGTSIGWSFDGCTTNDYIPYWLNGSFPGGVHHYTGHKFVNITPWTLSQTQNISVWGHFEGTSDYQVH
jgi:hypothetical protein